MPRSGSAKAGVIAGGADVTAFDAGPAEGDPPAAAFRRDGGPFVGGGGAGGLVGGAVGGAGSCGAVSNTYG